MHTDPKGTGDPVLHPVHREFSPKRALKFVVFVVAAVIVSGFAVMVLWNLLMPALFGTPVIRFWQAVGLLFLSRILFGGLRGHGSGRRRMTRRRIMQRWAEMSPEEREKFRQGLQGRCGPSGTPAKAE